MEVGVATDLAQQQREPLVYQGELRLALRVSLTEEPVARPGLGIQANQKLARTAPDRFGCDDHRHFIAAAGLAGRKDMKHRGVGLLGVGDTVTLEKPPGHLDHRAYSR